MINKDLLAEEIAAYKESFPDHWKDEQYKWEAVHWFQKNWDINALDFAEMLERSLEKTFNLLTSYNTFPKGMIVGFSKAAPEEVRGMFIALFDESKDIYDRMEAFKSSADLLLEKYGNGAKQHYQYENAISTYLWMRYPDQYYIYKYSEAKELSKRLQSDLVIKKGAYADNIRNYLKLYDEIAQVMQTDVELKKMLSERITDSCYPDPQLRIMAGDFGHFEYSYNSNENPNQDTIEWWPTDYDTGITTDKWIEILNDSTLITDSNKKLLRRMKDFGGAATCAQLSQKYGDTPGFYNMGASSLAKRIGKKLKISPATDKDGTYWFPILFLGKHAEKDTPGVYIWKLRDELSKALDHVDYSDVDLYENNSTTMEADDGDTPGIIQQPQNYWWLNANPKIWSFASMAIGAEQGYTLYNESGNKRRIFQNFLDAKEGDMVIGYESNPVKQVVGIATISKEQDGESLYFRKVEGLSTPIDYLTLKACPELANTEYFVNPQGSLFKLTKDEYEFIMDVIREENPIEVKKTEKYTKADFLDDVFMTENQYETLAAILKKKKNVILQGAPGVGKTYAATRLAYSLMGEKDDSRIELIQFHQNYSYEDFMMGYKPAGDGFELRYGVFYRFCQKASNQPDKDFFFIIDEINRGNMSKIFGELLMSIEKDYRNKPITLAYTGMPFSVPKRLHIIGMMNTADRSLAMIDYALRRRFSFFAMEPGFDTEGFLKRQKAWESELLDALLEQIKELNKRIASDKSLGKGFCIGHSYFCGLEDCSETELRAIVEYDILPMLSEYWFDEPTKLQEWENRLRGVFQK